MVEAARKLCELWERILFTFGFWIFWIVWNILGAKWLFRALIHVIEKADAEDSTKTLRRLRAIEKAGSTE